MRLLKKAIWSYFLLSAILLVLAVPAFYIALKTLMVNNVDEELRTVRTQVMPKVLTAIPGQINGNINFPGYEIIYRKEAQPYQGDSMSNTSEQDSRMLAAHFVVNRESYSLEIRTSMIDKLSLVRRIVLVLTALLLLLLAGLLFVNRTLNKQIWKPFYNTLQQLRAYRVDKQPALQLQKTPVAEFNDLNNALNELAATNRRLYTSQKEFAENASHELQSPLAVMQSKLELLMQTQPISEEQAALIEDLANTSKRLSRLNKSLVLLTRIDNNQFPDKEQLSLKDIVEKIIQQYAFQAQQRNIDLSLNVVNDAQVNANRALLEILISNLLSNAIRHNLNNGMVAITINGKQLTIANTGKNIPLDAGRIFERFYKDSTDTGSIGLGLETVEKICTLNHYTINYRFVNNMHTFTVTL